MTAIAFERGLFLQEYKTIESLHSIKTFNLPKEPTVNEKAVFLKSHSRRSLGDIPMREGSSNDKLRLVCDNVGLLRRFTMYSFRRTAIIETRRDEGTKEARELASHCPGTASIYAYDNVGFSDKDMTSIRIGGVSVSRAVLRDMFHRAAITPVKSTSTLKLDTAECVKTKLKNATEFVQMNEMYEGL